MKLKTPRKDNAQHFETPSADDILSDSELPDMLAFVVCLAASLLEIRDSLLGLPRDDEAAYNLASEDLHQLRWCIK